MSLQDPHLKMSKSHPDARSRILITDTPETIASKLASARTDSLNAVSYEPATRPGVANLLQLQAHFDPQGRSAEELGAMQARLGLGALKTAVAEAIASGLRPVRERFGEVMREDGGRYVDEVERRGARRARESAEGTMDIVRRAVGL
jgi:tryptophanyl-tRNA synthetase